MGATKAEGKGLYARKKKAQITVLGRNGQVQTTEENGRLQERRRETGRKP